MAVIWAGWRRDRSVPELDVAVVVDDDRRSAMPPSVERPGYSLVVSGGVWQRGAGTTRRVGEEVRSGMTTGIRASADG